MESGRSVFVRSWTPRNRVEGRPSPDQKLRNPVIERTSQDVKKCTHGPSYSACGKLPQLARRLGQGASPHALVLAEIPLDLGALRYSENGTPIALWRSMLTENMWPAPRLAGAPCDRILVVESGSLSWRTDLLVGKNQKLLSQSRHETLEAFASRAAERIRRTPTLSGCILLGPEAQLAPRIVLMRAMAQAIRSSEPRIDLIAPLGEFPSCMTWSMLERATFDRRLQGVSIHLRWEGSSKTSTEEQANWPLKLAAST